MQLKQTVYFYTCVSNKLDQQYKDAKCIKTISRKVKQNIKQLFLIFILKKHAFIELIQTFSE